MTLVLYSLGIHMNIVWGAFRTASTFMLKIRSNQIFYISYLTKHSTFMVTWYYSYAGVIFLVASTLTGASVHR